VPRRIELDLVDPVAVAVVRAQNRDVALGAARMLECLDAPGDATGLPRAVDPPAAALALEAFLQRDVDLEQVDRLERWRLIQDLTGGIDDVDVNRDSHSLPEPPRPPPHPVQATSLRPVRPLRGPLGSLRSPIRSFRSPIRSLRGPSRPIRRPFRRPIRPLRRRPQRRLRRSLPLSLAGTVMILGQPDLVEHQRGALHEPERDQHEREVLRQPAAERERAGDAGQDEQPGGAEADDARSSAHGDPPGITTCLLVSVDVVVGNVELGQLIDEPE
jgi:hypothetical protein